MANGARPRFKDIPAMRKAIVSAVILAVFVFYSILHAHSAPVAVVPTPVAGTRSQQVRQLPHKCRQAQRQLRTRPRHQAPNIKTEHIQVALPMRNGAWCRSKRSFKTEKLPM